MSYFTYRVFKGVPLDRLHNKVEANLALYEPDTVGPRIHVTLHAGHNCSAMLFGFMNSEEAVLRPIGYQLGCVWMDVRYQDGDSWDLSIYEGPEHRVSHDVNPWVHEPAFEYKQEHIDFRIRRVCELWPDQAVGIERYLLPWRTPSTRYGLTKLLPREGKAYPSDDYAYGDANQIYDFVRAFGLRDSLPTVTIAPPAT